MFHFQRSLFKYLMFLFIGIIPLFFTGCEKEASIISNVDEKEANLILVLLESKGIPAVKSAAASAGPMGAAAATPMYQISVNESQTIEAIAFLNQNGFPRRRGPTLLQLFAKEGFMSSDKEETIRYQAGLAEQISNTLLMIDGVIDASVQLSFPPEEVTPGQEQKEKITAAVYVKHQGVIDDPNIYLESKIKQLVSGSVSGLDINDVTVVSDRSRFTDIKLEQTSALLGEPSKEYVKIWSIVMSKESAARFRVLFFTITIAVIVLALFIGWFIWKLYPMLKKKGGFKELFSAAPIEANTPSQHEEESS